MTADRDNRAKGGRYGNARTGAITPRGRHGAKKPVKGSDDLGLEIVFEEDEVTQAIHNLEYDPVNKVLTAHKAPVSSGGGGGGETFSVAVVRGGNTIGTVAPFSFFKRAIFSLDRFPIPQSPAKAVDWTKLDLPLDFEHGDPIPAAPNTKTHSWPRGIGIARLTRGSPNVGGAAWNADQDPVFELEHVPAQPHYFFTKRGTDPTLIYCYFDKASISSADYTRITVNLGYTVTAASTSGPVLTLTVSPSLSAVDVATGLEVTFLNKALVVSTDAETGDDTYLSPQTVLVSTIDNDSPIAVDGVAMRGAAIEPASLDTIKVWMSGPIDNSASTFGWTITGGSPALALTAATVIDEDAGVIELTLDRDITAADLAGAISISHTAAITTQTALQLALPEDIPTGPCDAGGPIDVIYKSARGCYVLVINRFTEHDYKEGDLIDITASSFIDVLDDNDLVRRCYDSRLRESIADYRTLVVIGGNMDLIGNNVEGIGYMPILAPLTQAYDPDVDTEYPLGLGYGYLEVNGIRQDNKVLIRHNTRALPLPVLAGRLLRPSGTVTVEYDPGGGDPVVEMLCYTFDWY